MYNLLHRIDNGLDPLRARFEEHVKRVGTSNVEKIVTAEKEVVSGASPLVILGGAALILVCAPRNRKRTSRRSSRSIRRMPSSYRGPSGATRPLARRSTKWAIWQQRCSAPCFRTDLHMHVLSLAGLPGIHQPQQGDWHYDDKVTGAGRQVCRWLVEEEQQGRRGGGSRAGIAEHGSSRRRTGICFVFPF